MNGQTSKRRVFEMSERPSTPGEVSRMCHCVTPGKLLDLTLNYSPNKDRCCGSGKNELVWCDGGGNDCG